MAAKNIPMKEVFTLVRIMVETYNSQYNKNLSISEVDPRFIIARSETRIGMEVLTKLTVDNVRLRFYVESFIPIQNVRPYRIEDVQATQLSELGAEWKTFVAYADLDVDAFPVLSKTLEPVYDGSAGPYAIELEDGSGFIQLETGEYWLTEDAP